MTNEINEYAVIDNNVVVNVIMIRSSETTWYQNAFNCELVPRNQYGLSEDDKMQIGDYRENETWYRDVPTFDEATEAEIKVKTALAQAEGLEITGGEE